MPEDVDFSIQLNTLRNLSFSEYRLVADSAGVILEDVEKTLLQSDVAQAKWTWAEHPDLHLACTPNGVDQATLERIVNVASEGLRAAALTHSQPDVDWPEGFGSIAQASAFSIVGVLEPDESLTIGDEDEITPIERDRTRQIVSSVDGVVTMLSEYRRSATYARIKEWRTNNVVKCFFSDDKWLGQLTQQTFYKKHVIIYGTVTYTREGRPISIKDVTDIRFRSGATRIADLEGSQPNLTGRMGVTGFVKRLRGGDA